MNEVRTLIEEFWIRRDAEKETYFRVKRDLPRYKKFIQEQLGWRLISNERLLKLEKIPAHAESFMGITPFQDTRDYCILSILLMFLEDKEEQEQFLLSELIDFVELQLKTVMDVDWNSFSQRKSLVRALQYAEGKGMLKVYEGNSENLSQGIGQEVLYENTGFSRYFATSFSRDISKFQSYRDFEKTDSDEDEEVETDRGHFRINRVYRQLVLCPAMYWTNNEDADSLYLKNQRQWVAHYLDENLGGRLDVHKNAAFWMVEEEDPYGMVHPREAMLPELVAQLCDVIRNQVAEGAMLRQDDEIIELKESEFHKLVLSCRGQWKEAWSKEYREMEPDKLLRQVKDYMKSWMMLKQNGRRIRILPAAGKITGFYPEEYHKKKKE